MSDQRLPPPPPVDIGGSNNPPPPPPANLFPKEDMSPPPPPPANLGQTQLQFAPPNPPSDLNSEPDLGKIDWNTLNDVHANASSSMQNTITDPGLAQTAIDTSKAELSIAKMYGIPLGVVHGNLGTMSQAIYGAKVDPPNIIKRVVNTVKGSIAEAKVGELGFKAYMGDDSVLPEIKTVKAGIPKPEETLGGFGKGVVSAIVGMGYQAKAGIEGQLVGSAAMSIGFAMFGGIGAVAGLGAGLAIPTKEQLDHLTGSQYVAMLDAGLDPTAARIAAGALTVGLESLNFAKLGNLPGVKKLAGDAVLEGTKRILLNGTFAQIAMNYSKRVAGATIVQGGLSLATAVYQTAVTEAAKALESKIDGKTFTREQFSEIVKGWGVQTAVGTTVGLAMSAAGVAGENANIKSSLNELVRKAQAPASEPVVTGREVPSDYVPYVPPAPGEKKIGDIMALTDAKAAQLDAEVRSAESSADYISGKDITNKQAVDDYKSMLEARTLQKKHFETINSVDTSQMRPEYAEPLKRIQEQFTPENFNEKSIAKLSELKRELEANPEMAIPKSTMDKIGEMDKTPYKDLSVDDLGVIADVFKHYAKLQQESHSINVGIQKVEAKVVAENVIKELPKQKELPPLKPGETRKVGMPTGGDRIKEGFKNAVDTLVITGQEFPDLIGQKIGDTYRKVIVTPVKEGVTKMHAYIVDRATEFRTMTEQVHKNVGNVHGWLSEVDVVNAKNSAGEPTIVDVNKAEMLTMYMHSLNKSNRRHLVEGGFGFRFRRKGMRDVVLKLDEAELKRIQGVVESDPNMKSYVEAAKSVLSKTGKDQATVHLDINDVPLPLEDNYYHIDTMPIGRKKAAEEAISTESKQGVIRVGIDKGQLEARTGAAGPIYINPITHDLAVSIQHAAAYVNLEKPLINASRLHYNGDVQSKLGAVTGPKTWKVMDKFLKDAAQQVGPKTDLDMMFGKIRNNMATSMMGAPNLFIPLKQAGAIARYSSEVSPGYMLKGLYASIAHPKTSQDFLTRNSSLYKTRRVEGINMAAADIMKRGQVESQFGGKEGLSQKLMSPISWADTRMSVRPGMMGAYMQALDEMVAGKVRPRTAELIGKDANTLNSLPPDEQIPNAIKFAEVVTERTQTSGNHALMNDFQRGGTTSKLFSLFQSEGVVGMNMRRRAFVEAQKSKSLGGWARFTKVMAISLLAEPLFETAIDEARRTFNAKESVGSAIRRYPKDVMAKAIQQATSGIPLVRDAAQYITNKKLLGINYQNQGLTPVDNLVNDATVTVGTLLDPSTYRSWHNAYKAAGNMADLAGALSGLPIAPLKRTVEGAINIVKKATE